MKRNANRKRITDNKKRDIFRIVAITRILAVIAAIALFLTALPVTEGRMEHRANTSTESARVFRNGFAAGSLPLTPDLKPLLALAEVSAEDGTQPVADGTYQIEVTMEGGSGRASIDSPTEITFSGENATARIRWSSPHYDYMLVDGKKYLPVNEEGNSEFLIPVSTFDKPFPVIADTTAMSEPHEITYTLVFDKSTLQKTGVGATELLRRKVYFILLLTMAVWAFYLVMTRGRRRQGTMTQGRRSRKP